MKCTELAYTKGTVYCEHRKLLILSRSNAQCEESNEAGGATSDFSNSRVSRVYGLSLQSATNNFGSVHNKEEKAKLAQSVFIS